MDRIAQFAEACKRGLAVFACLVALAGLGQRAEAFEVVGGEPGAERGEAGGDVLVLGAEDAAGAGTGAEALQDGHGVGQQGDERAGGGAEGLAAFGVPAQAVQAGGKGGDLGVDPGQVGGLPPAVAAGGKPVGEHGEAKAGGEGQKAVDPWVHYGSLLLCAIVGWVMGTALGHLIWPR